jgi:hypothetical protein
MALETPGTVLFSIPDRLHLDDELVWFGSIPLKKTVDRVFER